MSDVSLRRLIDIMKVLKKYRVIVTIHHFLKIITDMEVEYGLRYQVFCTMITKESGFVSLPKTNVMNAVYV